MSNILALATNQLPTVPNPDNLIVQVADLCKRLDQPRLLRQLTERQRRDAGLQIELDGHYSEVFRRIGWN